MELKLRGKNAVVTGGCRGHRGAICERLGRGGRERRRVGHRPRDGPRRSRSAAARAGRGPCAPDGPHEERGLLAALVDKAEELLGSADILVNNAGLWPTNLVTDIGLDEWRRTIDINLTAVFLASQRFVQLDLGEGPEGQDPQRHLPGGLQRLDDRARALRGGQVGRGHLHDLALPRGRRQGDQRERHRTRHGATRPWPRKRSRRNRAYYEKRIQIGRIAQPIEVARLAVFLVSGAADYFTGATSTRRAE